jgi:hypothetical protein
MSSSRRARRSGLVFGFVASSKTSGLPSHKRRLTSWTPPRNDPNRSWPNCLMSSTRRARRSALDFVGFVIVISKNPLTDRAPARRPDFVGQRAGVRALRLRPVWGCSPNEAGGGGTATERVFANFLRVFKASPSGPDPAASQFHSWGGSAGPSSLTSSSDRYPRNAGRMRLSASTAGVLDSDCGRPKRLGGRRRPRR